MRAVRDTWDRQRLLVDHISPADTPYRCKDITGSLQLKATQSKISKETPQMSNYVYLFEQAEVVSNNFSSRSRLASLLISLVQRLVLVIFAELDKLMIFLKISSMRIYSF